MIQLRYSPLIAVYYLLNVLLNDAAHGQVWQQMMQQQQQQQLQFQQQGPVQFFSQFSSQQLPGATMNFTRQLFTPSPQWANVWFNGANFTQQQQPMQQQVFPLQQNRRQQQQQQPANNNQQQDEEEQDQEEVRAARTNRAVSNGANNNFLNSPSNNENGYQTYGSFIKDCLQTHNKYRAMHGVPPLKSSKKVMRYSRRRAKELAETDHFAHPAQSPYGENLAFSSFKGSTCSDLMKMWYDEINLYNWQNPSFNSEIGHFTQLVWKDSVRIGCARGFSKRGKGVYLVCNYDPPGNVFGEFRSQVLQLRQAPLLPTSTPPTSNSDVNIPTTSQSSSMPINNNNNNNNNNVNQGGDTTNQHINKKKKKKGGANKKRKQQQQKQLKKQQALVNNTQ